MGAAIGLVTGEEHPRLPDSDRLLLTELQNRGHHVEPVVWTDDEVDWDHFDLVVIRACFEYYTRPDDFRDWLGRLEELGVTVRNPPSVVRWNMHKFYLRDLIEAGVEVLPTAFVEAGSDVSLEGLLEEQGWSEAVVKPAIGTSSAGTWKTSLASAAEDQQRFDADLAEGDRLVQAFAPEIEDGERSSVFIDGSFSHAWLSVPPPDEYRSHHRFGGTSRPYEPPAGIVEDAKAALETALDVLDLDRKTLPYARVDGIERDGRFVLMELELVEPYLGLGRSPDAASELAEALERELDGTSDVDRR